MKQTKTSVEDIVCDNCEWDNHDKIYKHNGELLCQSCFLKEIGMEELVWYTYPDACTSFGSEEELIEHYTQYERDVEVIE
ncbi:MAG: hypothetical protein R3Y05_01515 [bacterium]